jgi:hypothetical protein
MNTAKRRLFSVCSNKVMVISEPDHRTVIATVPIGGGSDGAGFDPDSNLAFSSNGEGTLTVVGESSGKYVVLETVPTESGARTMVLDPKTHRILLPTADFQQVGGGVENRRPSAKADSFHVLVVGK